jgi:DNA-binding NarL/FixJ family response regulator
VGRRLRARRRDLEDAGADLDMESLFDEVAAALLPFLSTARTTAALSAREGEVALLLADGLSNRAIADRLGLSVGTVRVHVEHILSKLGLRSRVQVATWVREQAAAQRRTA